MKRLFPIAGLMCAIALSNAAFAANPQAANAAQQKPTFALIYDKLISSHRERSGRCRQCHARR